VVAERLAGVDVAWCVHGDLEIAGLSYRWMSAAWRRG
jgi:hypothetical protein